MNRRQRPACSTSRTKRGIRAIPPRPLYSTAAMVSHSAPINAAVLRWASKRRGLSLAGLRKTLRVSEAEIGAWEQGTTHPPYAKAQQLAKALRIPFGFLFLSAPPPDDVPLPDLRTRRDRPPEAPSPDLLEVINDALRRQEWYREQAEETGMTPLPFIRKYSMTSGASTVADNMRNILRVTEDVRRSCNSLESYLTRLTRNAELAGILVMRSGVVKHDTSRALSADEFQGFALCDDLAPVIFINVQDAVAARIFTFAHEAAHLWIGESGISAPSRITDKVSWSDAAMIERFCHSVAAELLVPRMELWELWPQNGGTALDLAGQFARHFWVSRIVVLRRAFDLNLIDRSEFFAAVEQVKRHERSPKKAEGGNPYFTIPARNSARLTDSVLGALRERRLVHTDAGALLAISQPTLLKLARKRIGA